MNDLAFIYTLAGTGYQLDHIKVLIIEYRIPRDLGLFPCIRSVEELNKNILDLAQVSKKFYFIKWEEISYVTLKDIFSP